MNHLTCRIKPYIQPFERQLALQELKALATGPVIPLDGDAATALTFSIDRKNDASTLRKSLVYWQSIGNDANGITNQLLGEATSLTVRNGAKVNTASLLDSSSLQIPTKRCLRYATHGLHEYRGKFFPQLVGALMNIAELARDSLVLDPMCGSGTTLVEARLAGRRSVGMDMNPLSVFVAKAKCRALSMKPRTLVRAYQDIQELVNTNTSCMSGSACFAQLLESDQAYLNRWFGSQTLSELDRIDWAIRQLPDRGLQTFYRVCMSNILRFVSWQKDDDLRVRRCSTQISDGETIGKFLDEARRSTRTVATFLAERRPTGLGRYTVREADAREAAKYLPELVGKVDAIITSPPYATALPYIDTDRLSLIYLGLLPHHDHRRRDALMIGNREVTTGKRAEYWSFFEAYESQLPSGTSALVRRIDSLNKGGDAGFRRRNLSALLAKYFFDMRKTLHQAFLLLKPGGTMFLIVGDNRTTAGGEQIEIRTAEHLSEIACGLGFRMTDELAMDMLASRDVFRKNTMRSEQIMRFDKPQ